jgi:hypothetical protein
VRHVTTWAPALDAQLTVRNAARLAVYEDRMMMQKTPYASATMRTAQLRLRGCGICDAGWQRVAVRPSSARAVLQATECGWERGCCDWNVLGFRHKMTAAPVPAGLRLPP